MESALQEKVLQVTKTIEKQVDAAIEKIDNLDVNDMESLRKQRLKELKELEEKRKEWLKNGHGKYEELAEEKMFFDIIKKSENVIIHFFTNTSERSRIFDMHLKILAPKHLETLFTSLNAEKCPFLAENLKIKTIPTIVLIKNSIMIDKIIGFTHLGNRDDFTTELLEWRIAHSDVINYEGDLTTPPNLQEKQNKNPNKKIRDGIYNAADDDDLDLDDYTISNNTKDETKTFALTAEEENELGLNNA